MRVTPRRGHADAVPRPRPAEPETGSALQHCVVFHRSRRHLVEQLVPLAREALDTGRTVALAVGPDTEHAVRAAVAATGRDDPPLVALPGVRAAEAGSGQSVALRRARELRELVAVTGSVTVLAEHLAELDGPDGRFWTEFEAAEHLALADLPVRLVCFYPEMPLHLSVLDGARRTHPHVLADGVLHPNPAHRPPRAVLAEHPPAPPVLLGAPDHRLRYRPWQLRDVRRLVRQVARDAGYGPDRIDDVVLAVNEVATNAVEHGRSGTAELHLWRGTGPGEGDVTCEVHDLGTLDDPLPGLVAPPAAEPRGRGLWISRQLCDLLHVWTDRSGTHVRLHCGR